MSKKRSLYNLQQHYQQQPENNFSTTNNSANFKTSVVRHASKTSHSQKNLRNQLSRQQLNDLFHGLNINQGSGDNTIGYLSTVHENDNLDDYDSDVDEDYNNKIATLTKENVERFNETFDSQENENEELDKNNSKMIMLAKYMESNDDFDDFDDQDNDDFSKKLSTIKENPKKESSSSSSSSRAHSKSKFSTITMPVSKNTLTPGQIKAFHQRSESIHSLSSLSSHPTTSKSSAISNYSESETTEHSDYADDFEDIEDQLDLSSMFKQQQLKAQKKAESAKKERESHFATIQKSIKSSRNPAVFLERDHSAMIDDFVDDFDKLDTRKLYRFKILDPSFDRNSTLTKKSSLPVLRKHYSNGQSLTGSPTRKGLRKFSSTLDLPRARQQSVNPFIDPAPNFRPQTHTQQQQHQQQQLLLQQQQLYYNEDNLDEIEDLPTDDLTITLSDYKKLKRKSQLIDLTKYTEEPIYHTSKRRTFESIHTPQHQRPGIPLTPGTNNSRLSKEGKLKIIRSMGKFKSKQVLPGHLYGEIVYDPDQKKWCGNEEELAKFEVSKPGLIRGSSNHNSTRPPRSNFAHKRSTSQKLIKPIQASKNLQVVGNMVYDNEKLRWVSVTGKYEDDPFENMDDTIITETPKPRQPRQPSKKTRSRSPSKRVSTTRLQSVAVIGGNGRATSNATSTTSLGNNEIINTVNDTMCMPEDYEDYADKDDEAYFQISQDDYKAWKFEEQRWVRKVGNWFPDHDDNFKFCYELKSFLEDK